MKRFLFLAVLMSMFAIGNVSAQVISYSQTKVTKLEKERKPVELQQFVGAELYLLPNDPYVKTSLGVYYELGAKLNKTVFLGGGIGLGNAFNNGDYISTDNGYHYGSTSKGLTSKAYVNAKFYLSNKKIRPYFDLSAGLMANRVIYYGYTIDSDIAFDLYVNPQLGFDYHIGGNIDRFFINIGYCISSLIKCLPETGAVAIKLGVNF